MNIKTGLEIFKSFWLIEPQAALSYLQLWEQFRQQENPLRFRAEELEQKTFDKSIFLAANGKTVYAPTDLWSSEAMNFAGFKGAETVIISLDGPLMKNDYCGWAGTGTILNFFRLAEQTESVKRIILQVDSPGGTVDGTQPLADAVANSQKETIAIVSGMCCSAAYWIASGAKQIYAASTTDIIGSIGTMVSWYDRSQYLESNGIVLREYYATKSADKNRAFSEANKGDGKLLVKSMLNPLNNEFVSSVENNRAGKINAEREDVLTGNTYISKDALKYGLIDGIKNLDQILSQPVQQKEKSKSFNMKNFNLVIAAANIAGVYEENNFFGLTEDQLEAVEAKLKENEDSILSLQTAKADAEAKLAESFERELAANENFAMATAEIEQLQNQIAELKKADGTAAAIVAKEADAFEKPANAVPKTSIDKWWETINK